MGNCMQKRKFEVVAETDDVYTNESQLEVARRQSGLYSPLGAQTYSDEKTDLPTESPTTKKKISELAAENEQLKEKIRILEGRTDNEDMIEQMVKERLKKRMEELNDSSERTANCSYETLGSQTTLIATPISSTHHERRKFTESPILANVESPITMEIVEQDENRQPSAVSDNYLKTTQELNKSSVNNEISETETDEMSLARLRAASLSSEEEDCCPEAYRTNRDERPVMSLPTPIRLNQVSPSTLEKFVDKAGRPQRKKINRLMQLRNEQH